MNALLRWMGWIALALASVVVQAQDLPGSAALSLRDGWIRAAPPDAPVRAGYGVIGNAGKSAVVIDAVRSEAFGAIEIHEMRDVEGVMRMRRVPRLVLEPGRELALEPGGLHLMLFRPAAPLAEDARVEIRFLSGEIEVARGEFRVRQAQ